MEFSRSGVTTRVQKEFSWTLDRDTHYKAHLLRYDFAWISSSFLFAANVDFGQQLRSLFLIFHLFYVASSSFNRSLSCSATSIIGAIERSVSLFHK